MRTLSTLVPLTLVLTACGGGGPHDPRGVGRGETLLKVSASGEAEARPDNARFTAGVESYGADAKAAAAANNAAMAKVIAAIEAQGVAKDDLQTRNVSLDRSYYDAARRRYVASNSVVVRVRKIDDTGKVIAAATAAGGNSISGPEMIVSDPESVNRAAIAAAYKAARARADAYAKATGLRVARIVSISDGQASESIAYAADAMAEQAQNVAPPIRTGMNRTSAQVQIDFALAP